METTPDSASVTAELIVTSVLFAYVAPALIAMVPAGGFVSGPPAAIVKCAYLCGDSALLYKSVDQNSIVCAWMPLVGPWMMMLVPVWIGPPSSW